MKLASWRLVRELLGMADVALELLDSRDPLATRSARLESLAGRRGVPVIIVLNKADLIPRSVAESWKRYFLSEGYRALYISARERLGTRLLRRAIREGSKKCPTVAAVFGVPKVGKSTLINTLKGRHSAATSPYPGTPGYTRRSQLFRIGSKLYLIDTPGLVPPEGGDVESVIRSKPVDSIRNPVDVAIKLINKVLRHNPTAFLQAYGVEGTEPEAVLRGLALKRGWVYRKDGEPNLFEASKALIRDYLDGKITYYTTPPQPSRSRR